MVRFIARPLRTPACGASAAAAADQLDLPLRPAVVATCVLRHPRRPQRSRPAASRQAVQLVIAFPARPRRHRPVNPHAAANALALQHQDIAVTIAGRSPAAPHRNALLGRVSSAEELAFLQTRGSRF